MSKLLKKGKLATAETVEAFTRQHFGNDKEFAKLLPEQQILVTTNLTTMLVKMNFIELKNELEDSRLNVFFVEETMFGKGYKLVLQDLLKVQVFSDTQQTDWYPIDPRKPRDAEVLFQTRVQAKIRFDYSDVEMLQYFTSAEKQAEYINNIVEASTKTKAVYMQQFIYNCFREGTDVWTSVVDADFITYVTPIITAIKGAFTNVVTVNFSEGTTELEKRVAQLTRMAKEINLDIKLATEKANLTNSAGSVVDPFHIKPTKQQLVLEINQEDMVDMQIYVKAGLFNASFLDLPDITVIEMSHIPLGTYNLFDKNFFQISPNMDKVYHQETNANTLWNISALHSWFYVGTLKYAYGIKKKIVYVAPTPPPTNIQFEEPSVNFKDSQVVDIPIKNYEQLENLRAETEDTSIPINIEFDKTNDQFVLTKDGDLTKDVKINLTADNSPDVDLTIKAV